MKPAYYMLAAVLIALAASALLVAIQLPEPGISDAASGTVVYVDLDALAAKCPAAAVVRQISAGGKRSPGIDAKRPNGTVPVAVPRTDTLEGRWARQHLEFVTAEAAIGAFRRFEDLRNHAADLNLDAMRAAAVERAAAEAEAEAVRLAGERADRIRQAALGMAADRLNAEMKVMALRAALKADTPDRPSIESMLAVAQSELASVDRRLNDETSRVEAEWRAQVDSLSRQVSEQAESAISLHAAQVKGRIASEISQARTEMLRLMGSSAVAAPGADAAIAAPRAHKPFTEEASVRRAVSVPGFAPGTVQPEVRAAAARQAAAIAELNGWRITFVRRPGLPDRTQAVLREMRRIWDAGRPGREHGAV